MRWAFVPPMPKAETAARRGVLSGLVGQGVVWVRSWMVPVCQSTRGVGSSMWRVLGRVPWRIACTILITPPTPAAAWVCPVLDFKDPR